jgi:hypothetical protein
MKTIKLLVILLLLMGVVMLAAYGTGVMRNHNAATMPTRAQLQQSLDRAIGWLQANAGTLRQDHNPALWWMIKEASERSGDPALREFFDAYDRSYLSRKPRTVWTLFFEPHYKPFVPDINMLASLQNYQLFFLYALSCDKALSEETVIKQQLDVDFCSMHLLQPRCVTHQLMGVRFLHRRNCGDHRQLSSDLADVILSQLFWDFRVTDSYAQRLLMLAESGHADRINGNWVRRLLIAQQADGGWADFHSVLTVGGRSLGWTTMRPAIGPKPSEYHTTAQAVWLLTLLIHDDNAAPG